VGENRWLLLTVLGVVYALTLDLIALPLGYWFGFVVERRFDLGTLSQRRWWRRRLHTWLVSLPLRLALLLGVYALAWFTGAAWWLWGAAGWVASLALWEQLLPFLVGRSYPIKPLDDPDLLDRFRRLAAGTGVTVEAVHRLGLSGATRRVNALLLGSGRNRRVLLGDTLLRAFTPAEIGVVLAHELGHHVHRHALKGAVLEAGLSVLALGLADGVLYGLASPLGYAGWDDPAALPLLLLSLELFALVVRPLRNAWSRSWERQADCYALARTGDPAAFRALLCKVMLLNKSDPDPHPLDVWFFHDHPPLRERIALANPLVKHSDRGAAACRGVSSKI
jgi:STE24 endopeptidase